MNNKENIIISLGLSKNLKKRIEEISNKKNISQNALIRLAISEYIEKEQKQESV